MAVYEKKGCLDVWAKDEWHPATATLLGDELRLALDGAAGDAAASDAANGDATAAVGRRDSPANRKRQVRITKSDSSGLGISIKVRRCG